MAKNLLTPAEQAAFDRLQAPAERLPGNLPAEFCDLTAEGIDRARDQVRALDPEISDEQLVWVAANLVQQLNSWLSPDLAEPLLLEMPGLEPGEAMPGERLTLWLDTILAAWEAHPAAPHMILPSLFAPYAQREKSGRMLLLDFADSVVQSQLAGEANADPTQDYGAFLQANFASPETAAAFVLEQWHRVNHFERSLARLTEEENQRQQAPLRLLQPASTTAEGEPSDAELTALEESLQEDQGSAVLQAELEADLLTLAADDDARQEALRHDGRTQLTASYEEAVEQAVEDLPILLAGPAAMTLSDWLAALADEQISEIAEQMSAATIEEKEWPTDRALLAEQLPAAYRDYLRVLPLQELSFRLLLARTSGELVPYSIILSCRSELTSGIFYLVKRESGYRLFVPEEIQAVLAPFTDEGALLEHDLGISAQETALALVNRGGLTRLETIYEAVNRIFADASATFDYSRLRRVIRQTLEITALRWNSMYRISRPYVYSRILGSPDLEELAVLESEAQHAPAPLNALSLQFGQQPPFTDPSNPNWLSLMDLTADIRANMDTATENRFLSDIAFGAAMELTLSDFTSLLLDYGINLTSEQAESFHRAFVDFQNTCPCWRLGGYSRSELRLTWSYEEALSYDRGEAPPGVHLHHDHSHHDHDHGHHKHQH